MTRTEEDLRSVLTNRETFAPPAGPVLAAVRRGVARRRRRRAVGVSVGVAIVAVLATGSAIVALRSGPASPATDPSERVSPGWSGRCESSALPVPAGLTGPAGTGGVIPTAMDPTGRYVVGATYGSEVVPTVVRWDHEVPQSLPVSATNVTATDVNRHGVVVGWRLDGTRPVTSAWLYQDGALTALRTPDGFADAKATAINQGGDVVGTAEAADGRTVAVRWPAGNRPEPQVLDAPRDAVANDIGDDGTVIGTLTWSGRRSYGPVPNDPDTPYIWTTDGGRTLSIPDGHPMAQGLRIKGDWVSGRISDRPNWNEDYSRPYPTWPVVWNVHTGRSTVYPDDHSAPATYALLLNVDGDVVYNDGTTYYVHDGHSTVIPALPSLDGPGTPQLDEPIMASDDATRLVGNHDAGVDQTPYRPIVTWHCR